jgi:hypothetical protein
MKKNILFLLFLVFSSVALSNNKNKIFFFIIRLWLKLFGGNGNKEKYGVMKTFNDPIGC